MVKGCNNFVYSLHGFCVRIMGEVSDNSLLSKFKKMITPSNSPAQQGSSQKHYIPERPVSEVKGYDSQGSCVPVTDDDEIQVNWSTGGKINETKIETYCYDLLQKGGLHDAETVGVSADEKNPDGELDQETGISELSKLIEVKKTMIAQKKALLLKKKERNEQLKILNQLEEVSRELSEQITDYDTEYEELLKCPIEKGIPAVHPIVPAKSRRKRKNKARKGKEQTAEDSKMRKPPFEVPYSLRGYISSSSSAEEANDQRVFQSASGVLGPYEMRRKGNSFLNPSKSGLVQGPTDGNKGKNPLADLNDAKSSKKCQGLESSGVPEGPTLTNTRDGSMGDHPSGITFTAEQVRWMLKKGVKSASGGDENSPQNQSGKQVETVVFPHQDLGFRYSSEKPRKFMELTFELLVAGEVHICADPKLDKEQRTGRLRLLEDIIYCHQFYQWEACKKFHYEVLRHIQKGYMGWEEIGKGEVYSNIKQVMLTPFIRNQNPNREKVDRMNARETQNEVVYCGLYQKGTCLETDTHSGEFFGKSGVMLHHICATCLKKEGKKVGHPVNSPECPHLAP